MTTEFYYITVEKDCELVTEDNIHRVLPETRVLHVYCCQPSWESAVPLSEKYVIKYPKGIYSRSELLKITGVVRIRTFDGAKNYVVHEHC